MPSAIDVIKKSVGKQEVWIGEVTGKTAYNLYTVRSKGKEYKARSTVGSVVNGTSVVMTKSQDGFYIVSQGSQKTRIKEERIING